MSRIYASEIFQALGLSSVPETEKEQVEVLSKRGFAASYFWYGRNSQYPAAEIGLYVDHKDHILASSQDMRALLALRKRTNNTVSCKNEQVWLDTLQERGE